MKSTPENENKTMNPQVVEEFEVGTRDLRYIKIYPLSMGDQIKLEKIIENTLLDYYKVNPDGGDLAKFTLFIVEIIGSNLSSVLGFVTDIKTEEIKEVGLSFSNMQITTLAKLIFEMNYLEPYEKNLKSLPLMDKLFQLVRPSLSVLEDTPNTESKIFTGSPSEKEESPLDNSTSSLKRAKR